MTVWRVYEAFHESSESGTHEYGYFSDHERAKVRALTVWQRKQYPPEKEISEEGSLYAYDGWSSCSIRVERIEVDKELEESNVGYT